mmetsp:Transcript_48564/g.113720  ORF Transcript_48564/g.113720 Transcript_48564/m.113720 type:complete len:620 (-) Transcript_48564:55-1914(-)
MVEDSVRQEVDVPPQQPQVVGKASPAEGDVVSDDLKEIGDCPWGARAVIEALSLIVTAEAGVANGGAETKRQKARSDHRALSCRFLMTLITIDALSWGTGKMFEYEVVLLVEELDACYLVAAVVMATAEIFIEFVASAVTPFLYRTVQRHQVLTSTRLAHFALRIYWMSNLMAFCIYPIFFVLIYILDIRNWSVVIGLGVTRCVQYAFGNQVGDAAVEMARPHWLSSFAGLRLAFPGCCCRSMPRLTRQSDSQSLALYLTLMRFIIFSVLAMFYVSIRKSELARWGFAGVLLVWNVLAPSLLLQRFSYIAAGLVDEKAIEDVAASSVPSEAEASETHRSGVLRLSQLRGTEISFLSFIVLTKGVPPQSAQALQSVLVLELPTVVQLIMVCVLFVSIVVSLGYKIYRRPDAAPVTDAYYQECSTMSPPQSASAGSTASPPAPGKDEASEQKGAAGTFEWSWMAPTSAITGLLIAGTLSVLAHSIYGSGLLGLYIAVIIWLPLGALMRLLDAAVDTFLLRYDTSRSSDLIYWQNVFQVVVNFPLLAVNAITIELSGCDDEEGTEIRVAGALLSVAATALAIGCGYYVLIDPRLAAHSLSSCVNSVLSASEATVADGKGESR